MSYAFPHEYRSKDNFGPRNQFDRGMTKREYFAAAILSGMVANPSFDLKSRTYNTENRLLLSLEAVELAAALEHQLKRYDEPVGNSPSPPLRSEGE
jgi:hypothetical protein